MTTVINRRAWLAGCLAMVALAGCGPADGSEPRGTGAGSGTPSRTVDLPVPTDGAPGEPVALPELTQQRWWTWAAAEATGTNPVADRSGADCARNQPDDVWFLAGTFGGHAKRQCTVPAGRPIVAPLVNLVGDDQADCDDFVAAADGRASMGTESIAATRLIGEPIAFDAVEGNPVTDAAGRYGGTACGLWVVVPPPAPGRHSLSIHGRSGDFVVSVDYLLDVQAKP